MADMELEAGEIVSDSEAAGNNNNVVVDVDNKDEIAQDVLLVAAEVGNGKEAAVESDAEGMFEVDSDPLEEDSSSSEDDDDDDDSDVNAADIQKSHIEGAEELEKMVQRAKDGGESDDDDEGAVEPPRTANEVTVSLCYFFFRKCWCRHCPVFSRSEQEMSFYCRTCRLCRKLTQSWSLIKSRAKSVSCLL